MLIKFRQVLWGDMAEEGNKELEKREAKLKHKIEPEDVCGYAFVECDYCCFPMKEAWGATSLYVDEETGLLLFYLTYKDKDPRFFPIKFCPFCGEPIERKIVKTTKLKVKKGEKFEYIEEEEEVS